MKTSKLIYRTAALVITALLVQIPLSAQALDVWHTVNDYHDVSPFPSYGTDIGTDASGFLYGVGSASVDPEGHRAAIVQRSTDGGATWEVLDAYSDPNSFGTHFRGLGSGAEGGLCACGVLFTDTGWNNGWFVRESYDDGATWTTMDTFQPVGGNSVSCADIKVSAVGDVYAAGKRANITADGVIHDPSWVVRKRSAGTSEYVTKDAIVCTSSQVAAVAIGIHPTAGVFVVGYLPGGRHLLPVWSVRRSSDGGQNWKTVDSFMDNTWLYSWAEGIFVDNSSGTIYVSGSAMNFKTGLVTWVVRRSRDGGSSWDILDSFSYGTSARAHGLTVDAAGNIFVCGYAETSQGSHWLVRKSTPGTTLVKVGKSWVQTPTVSWATTDDFQLAPGQSAQAWGVTGDASGNTFVTGTGTDASGVDHWIIRKLAAPVP